MTNPAPTTKTLERFITPGRLAIAVIVLILIAVVRQPANSPDSGWRFTTYSADPNGARGLYELSEELGWKVSRRTTGFRGRLDSTSTYLVLDPPIDLTAAEVGNLLTVVRQGAGLIVVPNTGSRLTDSLPVRSTGAGGTFSPFFFPTDTTYRTPPEAVSATTHIWPRAVLLARRPLPNDTVVILAATSPRLTGSKRDSASAERRTSAVVLGLPFGKGRVVAIADPTFLRNDVLRHGRTSLLAVRILEFANPDSNAHLVFDEYHHGFGTHANVLAAIGRFLGRTPLGLALLQLAIAGLILLAALGPRPLPPAVRGITQRRSALEHAEALAAAYEGAAATRTVARRLIRGLRRRHPVGTAAAVNELEYLAVLRERRPEVARDASVLAQACESGILPAKLGELLTATDHIDQFLRTQ